VWVVVLSGLGAKVNSMTTKKLAHRYNALWAKQYTFSKPGHKEDSRDIPFSFNQLQEDIDQVIDFVSSSHDNIILVWNSFISMPMIKASQSFKSTVSWLLLLSPSINPVMTIENVWRLEWYDDCNSNSDILSAYCKRLNVEVNDPVEIIRSISQYSLPPAALFPNTEIFINPDDKVNAGTYRNLGTYGTLHKTSSLPHDPTCHNVSIAEISNYSLLCED